MKSHSILLSNRTRLASLLILPFALLLAQDPVEKKRDEEAVKLDPFSVSANADIGFVGASSLAGGSLGATPGGSKDINFFRMGSGRGEIPHPNTLTAEGLFSQHDLPLELGEKGEGLFRVQTAATAARFEVLPDVRYLAQLGFSPGLRGETWQRPPLNLIAVVDKSGSMSGEPLALVRASLLSVLRHMRDGDQLGIVLYGDRAHVHLAPTPVNGKTRPIIATEIGAIASMGSTDMESGLRLGYDVARKSAGGFKGTTRVMLFTDERPNVGNTAAEGFMAMANAAALEGIGLTTIGVGVQFGAELAARISAVHGGNLFFFANGDEMKKTFAEDFDTMVSELARDLTVRIKPAAGFRIAGVFGVPSDLLRWEGDAIALDVTTIFLSRRKGAIYYALALSTSGDLPVRPGREGASLAEVAFSYRDAANGEKISGAAACLQITPARAQAGLSRGVHLVDEYLTLKKAAQAQHFANDTEKAFRLISGLHRRLIVVSDRTLAPERDLVRDLYNTSALLSGHTSEIKASPGAEPTSPLIGTWHRIDGSVPEREEFLVVWPAGRIESFAADLRRGAIEQLDGFQLEEALPATAKGEFPMATRDKRGFARIRYELSGDQLTLTGIRPRGEAESVTFLRGRYADLMARTGRPETPPSVDSLSGLPAGIPAVDHESDEVVLLPFCP